MLRTDEEFLIDFVNNGSQGKSKSSFLGLNPLQKEEGHVDTGPLYPKDLKYIKY